MLKKSIATLIMIFLLSGVSGCGIGNDNSKSSTDYLYAHNNLDNVTSNQALAVVTGKFYMDQQVIDDIKEIRNDFDEIFRPLCDIGHEYCYIAPNEDPFGPIFGSSDYLKYKKEFDKAYQSVSNMLDKTKTDQEYKNAMDFVLRVQRRQGVAGTAGQFYEYYPYKLIRNVNGVRKDLKKQNTKESH